MSSVGCSVVIELGSSFALHAWTLGHSLGADCVRNDGKLRVQVPSGMTRSKLPKSPVQVAPTDVLPLVVSLLLGRATSHKSGARPLLILDLVPQHFVLGLLCVGVSEPLQELALV